MWAVAFAVGDACAVAGAIGGRPAAAAIAAGALGLGAAWALRRGWPAVGGAAAWLALGAILGTRAARPPDLPPALAAALGSIEPARDDPHADDPHADDPHAIVGVVERGPEQTGTGARLQVEVTALDGVPATGILGLSVASGWPDFGPGEIIACRARLRPLRGTRNPGVPDPVIPLRAAGLDALAGVAGAAAIQRLAEPTGIGHRRAAFLARRALRAAIARVVRGEPAAFLRTAVLGERRGVSSEIEDGFRAAGATHVLSVSGLHLAAVAALFFLAVRAIAARIPRLALYVDPRAIAAAASLPAIALFTLITGEAVATERSALMLAIGMGALLCGRRASPAPTIAATALVLLCARPLEILDVSLQLSVASVSGIALVARRLGRRSPKGASWARRALGWLFRFGVATAAATAATAPLVAHCFAEVAPLAPLGNLALVPLVEMAVVPLGLAGSAAGALWPPLGRPLLGLAGIAARLTLAVAAAFRAYAPVWVFRAPNVLETLALTAAGALALVALALVGRWRLGGRLALGAALACAAVASVSLTARDLARRHGKALTVTFLDVGQGDAAVLEAPGGAAMLVDGGGTRDGAFDTGARIVEPFLRARGIGRLDVVALSHPHPDHLNGLFECWSGSTWVPFGRAATTGETRSTADSSRSPKPETSRRRSSPRPSSARSPSSHSVR